ncbi:MAG TPA: hypothetical protein VLM18_07530 [Croceibacterium sp.]|nr:hypothetical protein [Croceibacterium sp.]
MTKRLWLLRATFVAAGLFTLVMAWLPHPPSVPGNPDDKIQHIVAFVTLSALAAASFPHASLSRIGERLSFMGALIEVVQNIPALHRDCDIMDWLADTLAVAVTLILVWQLRRTREQRISLRDEAIDRQSG